MKQKKHHQYFSTEPLHWIAENFYRFLYYRRHGIAVCNAHFWQNNSLNHCFSIKFHAQNEENRSNLDDYQRKNVTLRMDGDDSFQDI